MAGLRKKGPKHKAKRRPRRPKGWVVRPCPFADPERRAKGLKDKQAYTTETEAVIALKIMIMKGKADVDLHVFRCPSGAHWHLGHSLRLKRALQRVGLVA